MSAAEVRYAWLRLRDEAGAQAMADKQSQVALLAMARMYRSLTDDERPVVDHLLGEQLRSHDETVRFDAVALIAEFKITSALPALRELADRLDGQASPGAPYEWAKVNRLVAALAESSDPR